MDNSELEFSAPGAEAVKCALQFLLGERTGLERKVLCSGTANA